MAGSSQLYKKSTFPPLLDSYLPLNCQNQNRANWQKPEKDKKEQIRNNSRLLSEEEKDELLRQALLEKHHLETYKNLYKIRNILYERYKALLNEKVLKQRIQIKAFDLRQQQQLKHKEQKCSPRRKLPFCKLSHDTKYLESISQSNSYWVTGLQNELTKLGIIKNQQDYESFWKLAWEDVPGSKIKEKLPDIKARMFAAKSLLFSTSTGIKPLQQVKSFPNNRVKKEASRDNTNLEDHCAKSVDICQPSTSMKMKMKSQQQMEQMFSKVLLSDVRKEQWEPLKSQQVAHFSALLHQKESDKRRKREMRLHRLHHLYYFSLIKMALSKRLLNQNGQFADVRKEQSVHDLMEYLFPNYHEHSGLKCNKRVIEENTIPCVIHAKQQEMHQKDSPKVLSIPKEKNILLKQEKHIDVFVLPDRVEDEKSSAVGEKNIIAMPLSLEDAALYHPVMEPKQIGKYWTNYTGKNLFNHEKY
ncbi:uncharacterized protein LOC120308079 isoform X2 [Crotalus tigris]|uniref:uncharacterized protein LOC120308079 isoform X2 n=1 Tax=Crotalus tigris TaxID=88082 RepID=UPI00192F7625|nr:uncharacterized protein LOC120308079 isoform X2 [Crotalus tigris]